MEEGKPSFTAEIDAVIRTMETEKPESERLCYDPFARGFLGTTNRVIGMISPLRKLGLWYLEQKHPFILDCIPARTRYIDEYVSECADAGLEQLIILGAGYDSRAYRIEGLKGKVTVFEIDHPATQKLKIEKLQNMLDPLPSNVVYVPIDFNKETLPQKMSESRYDKDRKSLFIWEGVTPYLTPEAVDETLRFVATNSGPGSSIIFSYILKSVVDGTCQLEGAREIREAFSRGSIADFSSRRGDRLLFGIEEGSVEAFLSERGFQQIKDISGDYYEAEYFTGPNRNRKGCCLCRVVSATVKPEG
ncbi:MAG: class I SAM-dependent methyltransferase [Deltaproteobacteria bacterium]|nr:MAG: class I SAM-dependent methyltransferase [Deltaproteobacteria bacterium]UCH06511.1 MAG: class I SAM-dependent methyltransferase [Deltaproteobacteria bacterium]